MVGDSRTEGAMARSYEHPEPDGVQLPRVLFALSDPMRLGMVRLLAGREAVNSLDLGPGIPKSTVAHHTRILREAGVTRTRPDGRACWISLRRDVLDAKFPGLLDAVLAAEPEA
jgi:DNA-binding transcriptional ArsR family regulator